MLQVVLLMPASAKTWRTGSFLSIPLNPFNPCHVSYCTKFRYYTRTTDWITFVRSTIRPVPVIKVVKVGFLTGFSCFQIHSPNSKAWNWTNWAVNVTFSHLQKLCSSILRCVYHRQLPSSILSRSDLAAASTCRSCSWKSAWYTGGFEIRRLNLKFIQN